MSASFREKPANHAARQVSHADRSQRRPDGRNFLRADSETAPRPAKTVHVTNPRKIGKGALIGTFDLELPSGIKFRGAMLLEMSSERWVRFPSGVEFVSPVAENAFQAIVLPLADEAFR
jgi:hypothetical protein